VLIIKTGYSEILDDRNNSRRVSFGDVLRATALLNLYKNDEVTWVADITAFPLLEPNSLIHKLLPYDFTTVLQLESEEFDKVINLEKVPGICALSDKIRARRSRYGFTFNSQTGNAEAYNGAFDVLAVGADPVLKKRNSRTVLDLLFEMVGEKWNGEEYVLGYKPKTCEVYDVALNTQVGKKWPTKAWPIENWNRLEEMLAKDGLRVTMQHNQQEDVLSDMYRYMDWINSAKTIVSNDSLGLHIGIALKKQVYGLFGPTPDKELYFYGRGKSILPDNCPECLPCFLPKCHEKILCINLITPEKVYDEIKKTSATTH